MTIDDTPTADGQVDVVLRDGLTVRIRPVHPDDLDALRAFLAGLSAESRLLRFFSGGIDIERVARMAVHPETQDGVALVATTGAGDEERIIAHGCYEREWHDDDHAEVALAVADPEQGRGLGTLVVGQLAAAAQANDVAVFIALVLPQNHRMLRVLRDTGFPISRRAVAGNIEITFPTTLTAEGREKFEQREQLAAAAAVRHVLAPASVAVIGASRSRGTPGGEVFHNLVCGGFAGPVYPVNRNAHVVQSVAAYPSIGAVPTPVELAVIAVPASAVVEVAAECAAAGVKALVVLSAGFAEVDGGGDRQRQLLEVCRRSGMRLVGPNCLGVVSTDPQVALNAQFGPAVPVAGHVGFLSQSGALGLSVIEHANQLGLGLSSFVSVGNKADLSGNDLLHYWESDPRTDLVLLYLESFGNPRTFARIARRLSRSTPIVAVKSGRTSAGMRAAASHTGALLQASDRTVGALFEQAGVIRTDTLEELFEVATLLANQPVPGGRRVGIVTNAGGPGIMCADACAARGLDIAELSPATRDGLRQLLPREAATSNPVDTLAAVHAENFRRAVTIVGSSGDVDAVIAIYIPPLAGDRAAIIEAIAAVAQDLPDHVPLLTVFMSSATQKDGHGLPQPTYAFPEDAVRALASAADLADWRRRPAFEVPPIDGLRHDAASALLAQVIGDSPEGRWLTPDELAALFDCYGIPLVGGQTVPVADTIEATVAAAVEAAHEIDAAVAIKAVAAGLTHKTDIGAVRLDLATDQQVAHATTAIAEATAAAGHTLEGLLVQPMVRPGVELLVGVTHDPLFGPVVVCGAGGVTVELVNDISVRIAPLAETDASDMLHHLATFPLLDGYRGAPKADVAAVEDLLLRVSALAEHQPTIAELDCNPIVVDEHGALTLDARALVRPTSDTVTSQQT